MNKYFEPVEFPDTMGATTTKRRDDTVEGWPTTEELAPALELILKELNHLQMGTSKYRKGGIQLRVNDPVMSSFKRFRAESSLENMKAFLKVAKQDVGLSSANAFKTWLLVVIKKEAHFND